MRHLSRIAGYRLAVELGLAADPNVAEGIGQAPDASEVRTITRSRKLGFTVDETVERILSDRRWLRGRGRSA